MAGKKATKSKDYHIGFIDRPENKTSVSSHYKIRAEIANSLGANLYSIPLTRANLKKLEKRDLMRVRYWNGNSMAEMDVRRPRACYDLSSPAPQSDGESILNVMASRGTEFVTHFKLRREFSDKWNQYTELKNFGIPVPETAILSEQALLEFMEKNDVVFIKPRVSSQGKGQIVICRKGGKYQLSLSGDSKKLRFSSPGDVAVMVNGFCSVPDRYLVQQGIDVDTIAGRVYDFRAVYQKARRGKIQFTGCYMRIGSPKSFQANIGQRGHPHDPAVIFQDWGDVRGKINSLALEIFEVFDYGLGEAGIDLVLTKKGDLVCIEINTRPGNKGFKMMREWVPSDEYYKKMGVIGYRYSNERRRSWGRRLRNFEARPILYCMHLINSSG
jgi:glutathione synthase/RimK-type ligase-like ATP-grasp enzyme